MTSSSFDTCQTIRFRFTRVKRDPDPHPRDGLDARARARPARGHDRRDRLRSRRVAPARLPPLRQPGGAADRDGAPPGRAQRLPSLARPRSAQLPPVAGLEALVRAWLEYVPAILPVAEALEAALITGEDGADAWRDRMGELREAFRFAIDRVERDGALAPGWTVDAAADWVWARCQPSTRRHLVGERGWEPGRIRGPDRALDPRRDPQARSSECLVHIERRLGYSLVRRTYPHRTPPPETLEPGSLP